MVRSSRSPRLTGAERFRQCCPRRSYCWYALAAEALEAYRQEHPLRQITARYGLQEERILTLVGRHGAVPAQGVVHTVLSSAPAVGVGQVRETLNSAPTTWPTPLKISTMPLICVTRVGVNGFAQVTLLLQPSPA